MTDTTHLALPFIDAAQAQKHVTHNEALQRLDALVQLCVIARNQTAPPASPGEGDRYLVGAGATGAFAGKTLQIATWLAGGWIFLVPKAGWSAYVAAEQSLLVHDGAGWRDAGLALRELQGLELLGVGATADSANPLSAKLNAALFAAKTLGEGGSGDLRFTLEKEAAGDTASQLYQTNWSGRAETGLIGDDDFRVKVSADGSTWKESIHIDNSTGRVSFPSGIGDGSLSAFRNRLRNAGFAINQRAVSGTVTLVAGAYGHDGVKAGAGGATYTFSTSGLDTTLTISTGSLILPIDAALIEGGSYTLSQAGAAQARVWQGTGATGSGAYASAPFTVTGLAADVQTNVEFATGTVLRPQFEPGAYPTTFERRPRSVETLLCQAYLFSTYPAGTPPGTATSDYGPLYDWVQAASNWATITFNLPTTMRASPSITIYSAHSGASGTLNSGATDVPAYVSTSGAGSISVSVNNTSVTGGLSGHILASAEI